MVMYAVYIPAVIVRMVGGATEAGEMQQQSKEVWWR
jgi:hypothetical protein